jgi:hypothetical protein
MTENTPASSELAFVTNKPNPTGQKATYGSLIAQVTEPARAILAERKRNGQMPKLTKKERAELTAAILACEPSGQREGLDFSRCSIDDILAQYHLGRPVDFETLGPYLASYLREGGRMTVDNLIPEDAIGAELAGTFRRLFPVATLVSLYDEYNTSIWGHADLHDAESETSLDYTPALKKTFHDSLVDLLRTYGAISSDDSAGHEYIMIAESSKVADAQLLVDRLAQSGHIIQKGEELLFVNDGAENPLHSSFTLRTKQGRWLCEALDAATFLKPVNVETTHIVVLPDYMKVQQDKVWELLRVLGIAPANYHNIFFDISASPVAVTRVLQDTFAAYQTLFAD